MKQYISGFAYITLLIAFCTGYILSDDSKNIKEAKLLTESGLSVRESSDNIFEVYDKNHRLGYLSVGQSQGYGGPLKFAILSDTIGNIIDTELLQNFETNSFVAKLSNKKYDKQFIDKKLNDYFDTEKDIDVVSGATVSSVAIAEAAREASYRIANIKLNIETPVISKKWAISKEQFIIVLIFLLGTISILYKKKKLRYISQALGFIFLGFIFNASLSLTHFGRILLGYFPDIHTHLSWWIIMTVSLSIILIMGKNVYCSSVCPFHASQILLNKISGINLKLKPSISKVLTKTPLALLWLSLILIFISANPTISSYEPFAMLFSLKGAGIQWYILPASLIGSLFFSNFFCRFFCPVGGALNWLLKRRNQVKIMIQTKSITHE